MSNQKRLAVIMPVFNASKYIKEAITSVLDQSYKNFDFYIIDDGSTDSSVEIIQSFDDPRIKLVKKAVNSGVVDALNLGLEQIDHEYIARMDADDICLSDRFAKQIEYLDKNPNVFALGGQVSYFGQTNSESNLPQEHQDLCMHLFFMNPFVHPTMMFRGDVFMSANIRYSKRYAHLEDYHLWLGISALGQIRNLPDCILKYRIEGQNISLANLDSRLERTIPLFNFLLTEKGIGHSLNDLACHATLAGLSSEDDPKKVWNYMQKLIRWNSLHGEFDPNEWTIFLKKRFEIQFYFFVDRSKRSSFVYWWKLKKISINEFKYFILSLFRL